MPISRCAILSIPELYPSLLPLVQPRDGKCSTPTLTGQHLVMFLPRLVDSSQMRLAKFLYRELCTHPSSVMSTHAVFVSPMCILVVRFMFERLMVESLQHGPIITIGWQSTSFQALIIQLSSSFVVICAVPHMTSGRWWRRPRVALIQESTIIVLDCHLLRV